MQVHPNREIDKLARTISITGHLAPVVIDEAYMILAGHARVAATKFEPRRGRRSLSRWPCEVTSWPDVSAENLDDPGPNLLVYGAVVLWVLGFPDRAERTVADAVALARRRGHRLSVAHTVYMAGHLAELQGDWEQVSRANEETAALAAEWGLMGLRQQVQRRDQLVAIALRADPEQIEHKRRNPQPGFARSLHDGVVAQALGRVGRLEEALHVTRVAID